MQKDAAKCKASRLGAGSCTLICAIAKNTIVALLSGVMQPPEVQQLVEKAFTLIEQSMVRTNLLHASIDGITDYTYACVRRLTVDTNSLEGLSERLGSMCSGLFQRASKLVLWPKYTHVQWP